MSLGKMERELNGNGWLLIASENCFMFSARRKRLDDQRRLGMMKRNVISDGLFVHFVIVIACVEFLPTFTSYERDRKKKGRFCLSN